MLDRHIKKRHRRFIMSVIVLEAFILSLYIIYIFNFTLHIIVFLAYVFIVCVSSIIFTALYIKQQTYYCHKKVKISLTHHETLGIDMSHIDTYRLPYFMYVKDTKVDQLKKILDQTLIDHILEIVMYDNTYACVKDRYGNEYMTYIKHLELI